MPLFRPLFLAAKFLALKIASQKTEKCGRIQHVSPSRQPMVQQAKNFLFRLVLLNVALLKLYNQGTMTFYAHENVENLGVYIFSCSFTRALICGKIPSMMLQVNNRRRR